MLTPKNHLFSETFLENFYKKWNSIGIEIEENAYNAFINDQKDPQKQKDYSRLSQNKKASVEIHHIIPKFDGGLDVSENLILLKVEDHILAHWLRWKVYKKEGDLKAFRFRQADSEERRLIRLEFILEARKKDQQNRQGFFNSEFQQTQGKKGGLLGGSQNTTKQREARQKIGKEFGRTVGLKNQSPQTAKFLQSYSFWIHDSKIEGVFVIFPKESFANILRKLNEFVPKSIPDKNFSSMYCLIRGERKKKYGWKIVKMLTRSEVEDGFFEKEGLVLTENINSYFDEFSFFK